MQLLFLFCFVLSMCNRHETWSFIHVSEARLSSSFESRRNPTILYIFSSVLDDPSDVKENIWPIQSFCLARSGHSLLKAFAILLSICNEVYMSLNLIF